MARQRITGRHSSAGSVVNPEPRGGVLHTRALMNEAAARPDDEVVSLADDEAREREFDECVRESGNLALRVAYAVLRNRADAEDVAQEVRRAGGARLRAGAGG